MKLYLKDLPAYKDISEEDKKKATYKPNNAFNLDRLPVTSLRDDFASFIFDRGSVLSHSSLLFEVTKFHNVADFLSASYPTMEHLTDESLETLELKLKGYLLKNGKRLSYEKEKRDLNKTYIAEHPSIYFLRCAYNYFLNPTDKPFSKEDDVWNLDKIPISLRASPINNRQCLYFNGIVQCDMKHEAKEAVYYNLQRKALSTVAQELACLRFLSEYLLKNYPEMTSFKDFTRDVLEEYLSFIYLEDTRRKNYRSELCHLKSALNIIGRIFDCETLRIIFLPSDFESQKGVIFKSYSDAELEKLHDAYKYLDKQTARVLIIHEILGLRISDTLTIK